MKHLIIAVVVALAIGVPAVAGAHAGHAHKVMGTVTSVTGNNVMVKTTDGKTVMVMVDAKTKLTRGQDRIDVAALKAGDRIVAEGAEDKGMIMAATVKVGAQAAAARAK